MKVLLDENLPKRLKHDFPEHKIFTVSDMGWNGKRNGELMQLLLSDNFDVLLTFDKNLQYQQSFKKYAVPVFVLNATDNTHLTLSRLTTKIKEALSTPLQPGPKSKTNNSLTRVRYLQESTLLMSSSHLILLPHLNLLSTSS